MESGTRDLCGIIISIMNKNLFLSGLTPQEFQEMLINSLEQVINLWYPLKRVGQRNYLHARRRQDFLRISLPTLADWTQQGIIHAIRMGRRVFYLVSDIQNALKKREGKLCMIP